MKPHYELVWEDVHDKDGSLRTEDLPKAKKLFAVLKAQGDVTRVQIYQVSAKGKLKSVAKYTNAGARPQRSSYARERD